MSITNSHHRVLHLWLSCTSRFSLTKSSPIPLLFPRNILHDSISSFPFGTFRYLLDYSLLRYILPTEFATSSSQPTAALSTAAHPSALEETATSFTNSRKAHRTST